jgi:hypothetical protein
MTFSPKWDPRGARPPPAPCASGGSDSCLIRARSAARAVRIPPFPAPSRGHASDQRARAHRSLGVRGGGLVQATVRLLLGRHRAQEGSSLLHKRQAPKGTATFSLLPPTDAVAPLHLRNLPCEQLPCARLPSPPCSLAIHP